MVELREQKALVVSFLHHMAVQRRCRNPLEDDRVVGIANYLDLGLQVCSHLGLPCGKCHCSSSDKSVSMHGEHSPRIAEVIGAALVSTLDDCTKRLLFIICWHTTESQLW